MSAPEASFEEFVAARMPALVRTAFLLVGNHHDAEDLVQVALVKAVPHWSRIAHAPEPFVRRIIARESISRWRRRRWREQTSAAPPERPAPSVDPDGALDLARALDRLAPRQRAVVVLRYYEDLTEQQTAAQLGIAVGTVKSQARDALARLRADLPGLVVDPSVAGAASHRGGLDVAAPGRTSTRATR